MVTPLIRCAGQPPNSPAYGMCRRPATPSWGPRSGSARTQMLTHVSGYTHRRPTPILFFERQGSGPRVHRRSGGPAGLHPIVSGQGMPNHRCSLSVVETGEPASARAAAAPEAAKRRGLLWRLDGRTHGTRRRRRHQRQALRDSKRHGVHPRPATRRLRSGIRVALLAGSRSGGSCVQNVPNRLYR